MTDVTGLVERVVAALDRLASLGETVADEQIYVRDLALVWTARLRSVAAEVTTRADAGLAAGGATLPSGELETALGAMIAEADRIADPHRAIDWLSTLPQTTLVALGEVAW
ncbi:MAG: hypothetical protein HW391_315 [Chloroflexi bacterium]|nr:hypothetical protein [Chloroflexota bacterium]